MDDEMRKTQEDIDLMLAQQDGELRYFGEVSRSTAEKTTQLYIKEVQLDEQRDST